MYVCMYANAKINYKNYDYLIMQNIMTNACVYYLLIPATTVIELITSVISSTEQEQQQQVNFNH